MKFIVDTQLPVTLARWLRGRSIDAIHVLEHDLGQADDREIWQFAIAEERIVISKDEDFFILANRPSEKGKLLWISSPESLPYPDRGLHLLCTLRHGSRHNFSKDCISPPEGDSRLP